MKKILLFFIAVIATNVFLYNLSDNILNQISATLNKTQETRFMIYSNLRLQRSLALFTSGVSTKNDEFVKEAIKIVEDTEKSFNSISTSNVEMKKFKNELQDIVENLKKNGKNPSYAQLLESMDKIENTSYRLSVLESTEWSQQLKISERLLNQYENLNLLINFLIVCVTIVLSAMVVFYYRKFNLEKMVARENQFRSNLLSSLSEAIFVTDTKGKIISCNQASQFLLGSNSLLMIGKDIRTLFSDATIEDGNATTKNNKVDFDDIINKGRTFNNLHIGTFIRGEYRFLSFNIQPVTNVDQSGSYSMIFTVNDISSFIEGQKLIKVQQQKLLEASRSDLIAQMAGGIAHEINNPLTAISNSMELLELKSSNKALISTDEVQQSTKKVITIVDRISGIVNGMLTLSRKRESVFEKVQLSKILKTTSDFSQVILHQNKVELNISPVNTDLVIECNYIQISQVLINLIKNSVDAIKGREIKWIKIEVEQDFTGINIFVVDSGTGIESQIREKILMPFFTSKEVGSGTGLGLSISKNIVESHHGEISIVESCENTTFKIYLPYSQESFARINF